MKKNKLLLIGWDAADWKLIGPLLAKGHMPALQKMIENGVYGNMSTMNPPYSPMLWSSVATGKTPDKHGILGFIEVMDNNQGVRPVTANSRKSRALWNIFHNQGMKSNLVGWWPSFPAEPINGVIVTDKFQKVSLDPKKQKPMEPGTVHPKSLEDDFKDLRMFAFEVTSEHILPFIPNAAKIDQEKEKGLTPLAKILSENVSVHNAATRLLRTTEWDFMAVYYDLIDHFCHSYMKFHPPKLPRINVDQYDIFKDAINGAYRFQDMMLERVLELIDDETTVIVMSDHGYESGNKRLLELPKMQAAAAMDHRQFGIFVAMGPNIKKNEKVYGLGLIDIAPTILHHYRLPIGEDMDGKVALEIFKNSKPINYIKSWEEVKGDFGELDLENSSDVFTDKETMEQLIELGYVERGDEKVETAVKKTQCDLKHNLARVHIGKKNYVEAKKILLELIKEKEPIDTSLFYVDLISICIENKEFDEAAGYLDTLKNHSTSIKYTLFFLESSVMLGKGKTEKALKILEEAQAQNRWSNSELWYKIGVIKHKLLRYEEAQNAYEKAIELEPDSAKYHAAIAENYVELNEFEEAAESALTSIELVRYYSRAHYVLGRALEKLGDLQSAKTAFETASRLTRKTFHRAEMAIENIEDRIIEPTEFIDKMSSKYRKGQITIVSGLPRSGTSLMMQMLNSGGMDILTDENRKADHSNPKGYFEYDPVMTLHKDNSWLHLAQDKTIKVVAPLLRFLDSKYRYKVIFMNRDLTEVVKSQQKMIGKDPENLPLKLFDSYTKQLNKVSIWKENEPGVELIYLNYKDVLYKTDEIISKINSFIGIDLDSKAMKSCVDKTLYRNKV
ncbi:alkaline phosphatase family protein [Subsaxibacter sp. CAU 1640]|uniref:alkaline phosphatase family protein n=1 Tax=Subsaxibacter sp. CAU 1640 TaxID=2933271 RepID=UPI002003AB14|nr:alkaline phosphatase family protein [Subsaxibacter sp. CAU 1640]MCK7590312.1 alkaline phosphatase family protein [Subsaxibacter sp. CAU 1640]